MLTVAGPNVTLYKEVSDMSLLPYLLVCDFAELSLPVLEPGVTMAST